MLILYEQMDPSVSYTEKHSLQLRSVHYLSACCREDMKLPVSLCNSTNRLFSFTETPSGGELYLQALEEEHL